MITVYFNPQTDWRRIVREMFAKGVPEVICVNPDSLEYLDAIMVEARDAGIDVVFISTRTGQKISSEDMFKMRTEMGTDPRHM